MWKSRGVPPPHTLYGKSFESASCQGFVVKFFQRDNLAAESSQQRTYGLSPSAEVALDAFSREARGPSCADAASVKQLSVG